MLTRNSLTRLNDVRTIVARKSRFILSRDRRRSLLWYAPRLFAAFYFNFGRNCFPVYVCGGNCLSFSFPLQGAGLELFRRFISVYLLTREFRR